MGQWYNGEPILSRPRQVAPRLPCPALRSGSRELGARGQSSRSHESGISVTIAASAMLPWADASHHVAFRFRREERNRDERGSQGRGVSCRATYIVIKSRILPQEIASLSWPLYTPQASAPTHFYPRTHQHSHLSPRSLCLTHSHGNGASIGAKDIFAKLHYQITWLKPLSQYAMKHMNRAPVPEGERRVKRLLGVLTIGSLGGRGGISVSLTHYWLSARQQTLGAWHQHSYLHATLITRYTNTRAKSDIYIILSLVP